MIDAHHHLWDLSAREHRWLSGGQTWASDDQLARLRRSFTLDDLAPLAAAAGVSGSVVIQTMAEAWETPDLLALAAGHNPYGGPDPGSPNLLRAVVGWVDLTSPGVAESVSGLRSLRGGAFLRGVRHPVLAEADPGWLARPEVLDGLAELATTGLCFDIVARAHQLPAAVTAARSTPGLTFVLDHLGGPPVGSGEGELAASWAAAIGDLAALPNVVCKLSGAHSAPLSAADLRPYYETVLEAFGPERLMFGSDWPVSTLAASYGEVCGMYRELTADLSDAERQAVFQGTAQRVYDLA